jgi:predicted N-acetyltransferase YhbS
LKFPPPTNPNRLLYLELKPDSFNGVIGEIQRAE